MRAISLQTKNTTYQMGLDENGFLLHLYYGKEIDCCMDYLLTYYDRGFEMNPYDVGLDKTFSMDVLPQEYPCYGTGDFRVPAINIINEQGIHGCDIRFKTVKRSHGKYCIPGLPTVYAKDHESETVEIIGTDQTTGIEVTLKYGVLPELDVITRSVVIKNIGTEKIVIDKAYSGCLDFLQGDYDVMHFYGRHGMERNLERHTSIHGIQSYGSRRGMSSHQHNPFFILAEKGTDEEHGSCYGVSLLYSGNFNCEVEKDQFNQLRLGIGIHGDMFGYPLESGESLYTRSGFCLFCRRIIGIVTYFSQTDSLSCVQKCL